MSCHNIGKGMDSVAKIVIQMYVNNEITKDAALRLFRALRDGVNWCDGNSYEATESISKILCGRCLKQFTEGEKPSSLWDAEDVISEKAGGDEGTSDAITLKYKELQELICEKEESGHGVRFNCSPYWRMIGEEAVSENVCDECFIEIVKKYLDSSSTGK